VIRFRVEFLRESPNDAALTIEERVCAVEWRFEGFAVTVVAREVLPPLDEPDVAVV
jgi:hypothetical protein